MQEQFISINRQSNEQMHSIRTKNYIWYQPAQVRKGWFGRATYELRFPTILNSLVDYNIFKTLYHLIRWRCRYQNRGIPKDLDQLERQLPMTKPNFSNQKDLIKYTWIGHSTAVISFGNDANFLIDPVFYERCSPIQCMGPKRFRPPACQISELPQIHGVLVSHDHYDHLDEGALQSIYNRFPRAKFFAGLDSRDVFPRNCEMHELNWTQELPVSINCKKFKVTFVPVCHWGRRGAFDKNKRLWGGFVIEAPTGQKVFYSGDTGYAEIFKELGQEFNGFDLSILPIGAYTPRQYLANQHIDPNQAVTIHKQIKSKKSVGVHWGTFPLGYEHYTAARQDLEVAKTNQGLNTNEFVAIGHGQSLNVPYGIQSMKLKNQNP